MLIVVLLYYALLQAVGDLLQEELDDIWDAAPKVPGIESSSPQRIVVDSFIEIYRDIDDIFEDEDDDDDDDVETVSSAKQEEKEPLPNQNNQKSVADELKIAFYAICNEKSLVSKDDMNNWEEIQDLLQENMLDAKEFDEIWEKVIKTSSSTDMLDFDSFVSFNDGLDELFVLDDDDDDEEEVLENQKESLTKEEPSMPMFYGDDLPAGVIFSEIADDDFLIGMNELKRWGDLQDMLDEGDLLPIELQNIFEQIPNAPGTEDKLNEEGFEKLYDAIDALFEGEDEETSTASAKNMKLDLLAAISSFGNDEERMPCGLESTEEEIQSILSIVAELEVEPTNIVLSSGGDVIPQDVAGDWDLLYTTSSTMKFNKGLSGLVPPNGKFGGLKQTLKASKYLADIEYIEQINAGPASFEVRVNGDWELRNAVSLFTGAPSVALSVEPDKVKYGVSSQRADHWKSLGPLNLLVIAYLDDDLRIMRGTTSTDSIFVFQRSTS